MQNNTYLNFSDEEIAYSVAATQTTALMTERSTDANYFSVLRPPKYYNGNAFSIIENKTKAEIIADPLGLLVAETVVEFDNTNYAILNDAGRYRLNFDANWQGMQTLNVNVSGVASLSGNTSIRLRITDFGAIDNTYRIESANGQVDRSISLPITNTNTQLSFSYAYDSTTTLPESIETTVTLEQTP